MLPSQDPAVAPPRHLLGIRLASLLETLALLGAGLAVDAVLFGGDRFAGISPHPFGVVVLLAAVQYGTREGLAAALLASLALLADRLPEQAFGEDLYTWLLRIGSVPVQWFIAGLVLGQIRDGHRRKAETQAQALAELRMQAEAIVAAYDRLAASRAELEARVAGQARTVRAMYAAARAIEQQSTDAVLIGVAALVQSTLGAQKFSLFLLDGERLDLVATEGWGAADRLARHFDGSALLFRAMVGERRVLTAVEPAGEAILAGEGLLAGPLVSEETGRVIGMLKIEAIPFTELNPSAVQNFRLLCEWIGTAYDRALRCERLRGQQALVMPLLG
ncbi:GAF domain-containing protein [Paracraurococcus lichenis]|uniref:GAF domain-containing protein n=1 Tax=Paracraurococcus lichenis TaxID=3064888 RepID=A0ABT9E728_9PROT|nr:GAF domain-containing protein [Paracraurococcus sp. LOR1-02]MDO9711750.1 GAF domain-containing protein [Paracraurococcus sp. LOR1-02]